MKTIDRRLEELEQEALHAARGPEPAIVYNDPDLVAELKARGVEVVTLSIGGLDLDLDV